MVKSKVLDEVELSVSVCCADPCWFSLLGSEGVFLKQTDNYDESIKHSRVSILPSATSKSNRLRCLDFVKKGGVAICEKGVLDNECLEHIQTIAMPYDKNWFYGLKSEENSNSVQIEKGRLGKGVLFRIPFNLNKLFNNLDIARRYVVIGEENYIYEEMAAVVKKNLRRIVIDVIKMAFFCQELPFVHKWYYPDFNRTVFCFRGDADGGERKNIVQWLDAVKPYAKCSSIFFCTSQYERHADVITKAFVDGFEVGSHNHWHIVFLDKLSNDISVNWAEEIISKSCRDYKPRGFVAPAYFYNLGLRRILEKRQYSYSSCFGLNHDSFPYFPVINGRVSDVLEVPFHCLGDRFPRFGISLESELVGRFFEDLIDKKYAACEPILLYGHPDIPGRMGTNPDLIHTIIKKGLENSDVKPMQLHKFASWWRNRELSCLSYWYNCKSKTVRCEAKGSVADDLTVHVEFQDGKHYLGKIDETNRKHNLLDLTMEIMNIRPVSYDDIGEVVQGINDRPIRFFTKRNAKRFFNFYGRLLKYVFLKGTVTKGNSNR